MRLLKKAFHLLLAIGFSSAMAGAYEQFFQAVSRDDVGALQALLQRGMDPNSRDPSGQTALYLALRESRFRVAAALLEAPKLDVNAVNAADESALMIAALKGQSEWSQKLLDRGALVNKPGWSPLHYAATGPEPAVVKLLLDRGADVEAASPNRTTPLMMAAQYGSEGSVDLLLARGADPKARNDRGLDAADFARLAQRDALAARLSSHTK
jgi:ankyrin repeat protein